MSDYESTLNQRYFRKTRKEPEGAIAHHGDCDFFNIQVCTCGLLHDLAPAPDLVVKCYPRYWEEQAKYDQARSVIMHPPRKTRKTQKKKKKRPGDGN